MSLLFISHSSVDRAAALEVKVRLAAAGFAALFPSALIRRTVSRRAATGSGSYTPQLRKSDSVIFVLARPRSPLSGALPR